VTNPFCHASKNENSSNPTCKVSSIFIPCIPINKVSGFDPPALSSLNGAFHATNMLVTVEKLT